MALALALVGAVAGPRTANAADPVRFRIASTQPPDSFNPFLGTFLSSTELFRIVYTPLMAASAKDYSPEGGLAESWSSNDAGTQWTFKLRDAKWSDGQPVTAEDVVWTFTTIMTDPDAGAGNGSSFDSYQSVTATDARTVVITTKVPLPSQVMFSNETPILPKHVWDGKKTPGTDTNTDFPMVGSGPFVVTEYQTDQFVRLQRNANYYGDAPKVDELVFTYFKDTDAAAQALIKGDVDLVPDMTAAQYQSLQDNSDVVAREATGRRFGELTFNPGAKKDGKEIGDGHPALRDVKVRQALHYAIDIPTIVDKVMSGYAAPGGGYIPPAFANWAWTPDDATRVSFDLAKANQLLDEAGYAKGADGIRRMPDGSNPLKFRLLGHSTTASEAPLSDYIKGWFGELGITVEPQLVSNASLNDQIAVGKFDMAFSGWSANADPDFILSIQTCDSDSSDTFYCDAAYDKLYAEQGRETDEAKRKQLVADMQRNLYVNAPVITLYYPKQLEAQRASWAPLVRQPQPDGVTSRQQGRWGIMSIAPAAAGDGAGGAQDDGLGTGTLIGIGALVAIVGAGGVLFALRRGRRNRADTE